MKYLCRIYVTQADKTNVARASFKDALGTLNQTEGNISTRVKWMGYEDVFFKGTKNYIRIIK